MTRDLYRNLNLKETDLSQLYIHLDSLHTGFYLLYLSVKGDNLRKDFHILQAWLIFLWHGLCNFKWVKMDYFCLVVHALLKSFLLCLCYPCIGCPFVNERMKIVLKETKAIHYHCL